MAGLLQRLLQLTGQLVRMLLERGQFRLTGLFLSLYPGEFLLEDYQLDGR